MRGNVARAIVTGSCCFFYGHKRWFDDFEGRLKQKIPEAVIASPRNIVG